MPFEILRNDITKMSVDVIVNSTSNYPAIGSGADKMIHHIAGPKLLAERKLFGFIKDTEAVITDGFLLPAKKVIHVAAPVYIDGKHDEEHLLYETYKHALELAHQNHLESIAFPLLSSGTYAFPRGEALEIALLAIKDFLDKVDMYVYLVVYDDASYQISLDRFIHVKSYIDSFEIEPMIMHIDMNQMSISDEFFSKDFDIKKKRSLNDLIDELDETFTESLLRLIDLKGYTDPYIYKKANIDRKLFSKIRSNDKYQPSKPTALALALALELSLDETKDLLARAGYTLSPSLKSDLIIQYCIEKRMYDLFEINQILFAFEEKTIGGID